MSFRVSRAVRVTRGRSFAVLALLSSCFLAGCASTVHVRSLASAGVSYSDAVDNLLGTTAIIAADADSARLLSQGKGTGVTPEDRRQFLLRHGRIVEEEVALLEKLRSHAKLLGKYFERLRELSGGGASESVREGVLHAEQSLEALAKELNASPLLEAEEREALGRLVNRGVRAIGAEKATRELRRRAPIVEQQLLIQRELLVALRRKLKADQRSVSDSQFARLVEAPFVSGRIPDEAIWIEARRAHHLDKSGIDALEQASRAASRLASAWRAFAENRLDDDVRREALRAAEAAVDLTEAIDGRR